MPTVTRQAARTPSPATASGPAPPPTADLSEAILLAVYGETKTGKTRLLGTFPKPLLLVGTEDGTRSLCDGRRACPEVVDLPLFALTLRGRDTGIDFVLISHTNQLERLALLAAEGRGGKPYRSCGLDNAGKLQELHIREFLGSPDGVGVPRLEKGRGWEVINENTKRSLKLFMDLQRRYALNVGILSHERTFSGGEDNDAGAEVIAPKVGCALTPRVAGWLHTEADYLGQTFKRQKVVYTPVVLNGKPVTGEDGCPVMQPHRTGKIEYCLRVGEHEIYLTGFRVPPGGPELPDAVSDPSYDKVMRVIRGEYKTP